MRKSVIYLASALCGLAVLGFSPVVGEAAECSWICESVRCDANGCEGINCDPYPFNCDPEATQPAS